MRIVSFPLLALVVSCSHIPDARQVSYSNLEPIGQSPTLVMIQPTTAVATSGAVDLVESTIEDRTAVVYAALTEAQAYARENNLNVIGPPLLVNCLISPEVWRFDVMLPTSGDQTATPRGATRLAQSPSGLAIAMDHHGSQETLFDSYDKLADAIEGVTMLDLTWEQYLTVPGATLPEDQRIRIFRAASK